jgi:hypothetical protein
MSFCVVLKGTVYGTKHEVLGETGKPVCIIKLLKEGSNTAQGVKECGENICACVSKDDRHIQGLLRFIIVFYRYVF